MTVTNALELARSYGVRFRRKPDGSGVVYQAKAAPPPDVVAVLAAAKPDFLRLLAGREAAKIATNAEPPPDCLPRRWTEAQDGLRRFVNDGWGDQAALIGWSPEELYRVPPFWARVDLAGAALLISDRCIIAVTETSIAIETLSGSRLKFRRIRREHLAWYSFIQIVHGPPEGVGGQNNARRREGSGSALINAFASRLHQPLALARSFAGGQRWVRSASASDWIWVDFSVRISLIERGKRASKWHRGSI
jgi:hypothetical protein